MTTASKAVLAALLLLSASYQATQPAALGQARGQPATSPRLDALRRQVEAGNRRAVESFWDEITKQGAPLIEPIKGDDRYLLVTFLWRAKSEFSGDHDALNWRGTLSEALIALMGKGPKR